MKTPIKTATFLLIYFLLLNATPTVNAKRPTKKKRIDTAAIIAKYEAHAKDILDDATSRMQRIWARRRDMFLNFNSVITLGPKKLEVDHEYHSLVHELAANLSAIPVQMLRDPVQRRRVQRLSKLQLYGLNEVQYEEAKELLHSMQTFITTRMVCSVFHTDDCSETVAMSPTIINHSVRTRRLEELEYYWLKWRSALSERDIAKSTFMEYVRLLRLAANYNGHVTPSRTWYLYYETDNFQRELENVVLEIMPLYQELHAYLRHSARMTYGRRLLSDDGAIPAPILDQLIEQAWSPRAIFRTPYPKSQLPTVQSRLEEVLVSPPKFNRRAAEFFESLGLNHMSDSFYEKFTRRITDEESNAHNCRSKVFYFPPDVALRFCTKLDYKKLMQMHGNMAELQYNIYRKELPYGVDSEPCPGFSSAIGEAAVIASGTPRHLNRLHILYNHSLSDEQSMNRLFRMGIHTIMAIPQYFINEKFLVDVMDGRIVPEDFNCAYWRLQYKYAGVVTIGKRNEETFDPSYKFYKGLDPENSNTVKFLAEVLGHQFYRAFCLVSGQYRPGDPEYPLHNCDFYGSKKAGDLMKSMMQLGATKHWRDVMEIATGERKLSGKGVMEYFAPLFTWLKDNNREAGLDPGWEADLKCGTE